MRTNNWKNIERSIAKLIDGDRVPVSGRQRGSAPDIAHPLLSVEVKHRKSLPKNLTLILEAAEMLGRDGVVFPVGELDYQMRRLSSFITLSEQSKFQYGTSITYCAVQVQLPALVKDAFDQAIQSAAQMKTKHFPVVFLHGDRMKVTDTIVIMEDSDMQEFYELTRQKIKEETI